MASKSASQNPDVEIVACESQTLQVVRKHGSVTTAKGIVELGGALITDLFEGNVGFRQVDAGCRAATLVLDGIDSYHRYGNAPVV